MTLPEIISAIFETNELEERFDGTIWTSFSLVFTFTNDGRLKGTGGYLYSFENWYAAAISPWEIDAVVEPYEQSIRPPSGDIMKKMLLQYNRDTGQVKADFEYDDETRWNVTPDNLEQAIAALRPVWD